MIKHGRDTSFNDLLRFPPFMRQQQNRLATYGVAFLILGHFGHTIMSSYLWWWLLLSLFWWNFTSDTPVLIQHGAEKAHLISQPFPPAGVQGGVYVSDTALMVSGYEEISVVESASRMHYPQ